MADPPKNHRRVPGGLGRGSAGRVDAIAEDHPGGSAEGGRVHQLPDLRLPPKANVGGVRGDRATLCFLSDEFHHGGSPPAIQTLENDGAFAVRN